MKNKKLLIAILLFLIVSVLVSVFVVILVNRSHRNVDVAEESKTQMVVATETDFTDIPKIESQSQEADESAEPNIDVSKMNRNPSPYAENGDIVYEEKDAEHE